jgi:tetratricopeptide (TPR) repeat protein
MATVKHLKNQARHEEQRENWSRAIELYTEALEQSAAFGEGLPDLSLYNRIGDLHLRQNDPSRAVEAYLEAVERYAEQELYGGAIALCDKILRVAPDRIDVYRTLGRLHAATGLVAEARTNFLEYASRLEEQGDEDGPVEAFLELARLTRDGELHLEMVDRLLERGHRDRATAELVELYEGVGHDGPVGQAVRERLESLAPDVLADASDPAQESSVGPADPEQRVCDAEERGDLRAAFDATNDLVEQDPDRVSVYRKRIELASGLEDRALLVRSYLELARCLERAGSHDAALNVHRRILELEPDHPHARRALRVARERSEAAVRAEERGTGGPAAAVETKEAAGEETEPGETPAQDVGAEQTAPPEASDPETGDRDFDDMLVGFRARLDATAEDADPEAHCEFGIALHQMGRMEDAIREFQAATRAPEPPVRAFELLGQCFLEQELHRVAVRVLTRALRLPGHTEVELLGVLYRLGLAHQALGATEQALECFERVYSIDIDFLDVGDRMRACTL